MDIREERHRRRTGRTRRRPSADGVTSDADTPSRERSDPTVPPDDGTRRADLTATEQIDELVPRGIRIAGSWSWRLIVTVIVIAGIGWLLRYLSEVTIPIAVAILLTALISPVSNWFHRHRVPRALSVALAMIIGLVLLSGTLTLIATQIAGQAESIGSRVVDGFRQVTSWLANGPFNISAKSLQVDQLTNQLQDLVTSSSSTIAGFAAAFGSQIGHFVAGLAIALFATFYFLFDGNGIWSFLTKFAPSRARAPGSTSPHGAAGRPWCTTCGQRSWSLSPTRSAS